jgi:hypothetical protein
LRARRAEARALHQRRQRDVLKRHGVNALHLPCSQIRFEAMQAAKGFVLQAGPLKVHSALRGGGQMAVIHIVAASTHEQGPRFRMIQKHLLQCRLRLTRPGDPLPAIATSCLCSHDMKIGTRAHWLQVRIFLQPQGNVRRHTSGEPCASVGAPENFCAPFAKPDHTATAEYRQHAVLIEKRRWYFVTQARRLSKGCKGSAG